MQFTESQKSLIDKEINRNNFSWPAGVGVIIACDKNSDGWLDISSAIEITEEDFNLRISEISRR